MAQIRYRANLSAKDFVFYSQNWGRSVVMKQYDQNFSRQIVSPTDPDKDIGIPQIFYCHNVMPAAQGFQSVGITEISSTPGLTGDQMPFQELNWGSPNQGLQGSMVVLFTPGTAGSSPTDPTLDFWSQLSEGDAWVHCGTVSQPNAGAGIIPVTTAIIGGLTYFWIPYTGCYSWDGDVWTAVTLTGLTASDIIGISESFGYMIAWSNQEVAWSSTLTSTDFTPSLETGAGGGSISALNGPITRCMHHTFGFIAFSATNCAAAVYSGNAQYPFNFREIIGGGGLSAADQTAALDAESGNIYAFTSSGMQLISITQATFVFPELTNYLAGGLFEDFNDITLVFSETPNVTFYKQIQVLQNRYLVISYGITFSTPQQFTHALVYDIAMKRWGKIKYTHIQAFSQYNDGAGSAAARLGCCLLDPAGNFQEIDFSTEATTGGTIILGKYQHSRDRLITLEQIDLEVVPDTTKLSVYDMVTYDGKTFQVPQQLTAIANTLAPQYPLRLTGMNHSLILQGIFRLDSLMLTYHTNGRR